MSTYRERFSFVGAGGDGNKIPDTCPHTTPFTFISFLSFFYNSCFFFKKLNISAIYKAIILIFFSVNLPIIFIYKFFLKKILIQPPGEPRKQHLGEVRATKIFIKDEITGRVDILGRIFEKIAKKLKMISQNQKKRCFW